MNAAKGDRIGVLVDFMTEKVHFFKNGINSNIFAKIQKNVSYYPVLHIYYEKNKFTLSCPSKIPEI